jgi:hypothetical protein
VKFATSECDACMQEKCCGVTEACFTGNPGCTDLHSCTVACPDEKFFISVGDGTAPPTPTCQSSCEESHPAAVAAHTAYDACIRAQCMPACAGS